MGDKPQCTPSILLAPRRVGHGIDTGVGESPPTALAKVLHVCHI